MKKILLVMLMACGAGMTAFAQQEKGDFQLQAQASYYNVSFEGLGSVDFGSIYLNASKFITANVEVGVSPFLTISTTTSLNLGIYGNYNFLAKDGKTVPYAGAQIFMYGLGEDNSSTGFGLKGGLRYYIRENVNIDFGPNLIFLDGAQLFMFNAGLGFILSKN